MLVLLAVVASLLVIGALFNRSWFLLLPLLGALVMAVGVLHDPPDGEDQRTLYALTFFAVAFLMDVVLLAGMGLRRLVRWRVSRKTLP
jgi:peptidoglycan/LPS O-acetylase OafA/YrhL